MTGAQLLINIMAWFVIHMFIAYRCTKISAFYLKKTFRCLRFTAGKQLEYIKNSGCTDGKRGFLMQESYLNEGFIKRNGRVERRNMHSFFNGNKSSRVNSLDQHTSFYSFFIWNSPSIGVWMVIYAIIANVPFILVQRYNRIRIHQVVLKLKRN